MKAIKIVALIGFAGPQLKFKQAIPLRTRIVREMAGLAD
jgi:hypothetical protein